MKKIINIVLFTSILSIVFISCNETYTPKPHGYFRTEFPEKEYRLFNTTFPYSFEYPIYAEFEGDRKAPEEKYWGNLKFKNLKATIHISYFKVENNLEKLEEDARKFVYKHTVKADAINPKSWENIDAKVYGKLFEIKGDAASSVQFYLTDSIKHFFRASLYFDVHPNKDSLAPSMKFIQKDIDRMIETFKWKDFK